MATSSMYKPIGSPERDKHARSPASERRAPPVPDLLRPWAVNADAVCASMRIEIESGLSSVEASFRADQYGPNVLPRHIKRVTFLAVFKEEILEPLQLLLMTLSVFYFVWGALTEAFTVLTVVILAVILEVLNEYRAKSAVAALSAAETPRFASVRRGGVVFRLPVAALTVGDVLLLDRAGDIVAADARLVRSSLLQVSEALLTGEAVPVDKFADRLLGDDTPLALRSNMVHAGTVHTRGSAIAVITAVGRDTEVGKVLALTKRIKEPKTPLQKSLKRMALILTVVALLLCVGFSGAAVLRGVEYKHAILAGLALAFATIPEELPILVKAVLAIGAAHLARYHVVLKRLRTAETLGRVSLVLTDKTGTLTDHQMSLLAAGPLDSVTNSPMSPDDAAKATAVGSGYSWLLTAWAGTAERALPTSSSSSSVSSSAQGAVGVPAAQRPGVFAKHGTGLSSSPHSPFPGSSSPHTGAAAAAASGSHLKRAASKLPTEGLMSRDPVDLAILECTLPAYVRLYGAAASSLVRHALHRSTHATEIVALTPFDPFRKFSSALRRLTDESEAEHASAGAGGAITIANGVNMLNSAGPPSVGSAPRYQLPPHQQHPGPERRGALESKRSPVNSPRARALSPSRSRYTLFRRGAPEALLPACDAVRAFDGELKPISRAADAVGSSRLSSRGVSSDWTSQSSLVAAFAELARRGRVVALVSRTFHTSADIESLTPAVTNAKGTDGASPMAPVPAAVMLDAESLVQTVLKEQLTGSLQVLWGPVILEGVIVLDNAVRPGCAAAVHTCQTAGIGVKMVTGDHLHTALHVARQVGIVPMDLDTRFIHEDMASYDGRLGVVDPEALERKHSDATPAHSASPSRPSLSTGSAAGAPRLWMTGPELDRYAAILDEFTDEEAGADSSKDNTVLPPVSNAGTAPLPVRDLLSVQIQPEWAVSRAARDRAVSTVASATAVESREQHLRERSELLRRVSEATVFARLTPAHKLQLVRLFSSLGHTVLVTGDGYNDGPALAAAHVGAAMGLMGTDAAREAANMVILDDNFATIAIAIRQGRRIIDNLRKALIFYLACKLALVLLFVVPLIPSVGATTDSDSGSDSTSYDSTLALSPLQVIILEMFMDLGAIASFTAEPAGTSVMDPDTHSGDPSTQGALARCWGSSSSTSTSSAAAVAVSGSADFSQTSASRGIEGSNERSALLSHRPAGVASSPVSSAPDLPPSEFRRPETSFAGWRMVARIVISGLFLWGAVFGVYAVGASSLSEDSDTTPERLHCMVWVAWLLGHIMLAWSLRNLDHLVLSGLVRSYDTAANSAANEEFVYHDAAGNVTMMDDDDDTDDDRHVDASGVTVHVRPRSRSYTDQTAFRRQHRKRARRNVPMLVWTVTAIVFLFVTALVPDIRSLLQLGSLSRKDWTFAVCVPLVLLTLHEGTKPLVVYLVGSHTYI